MTMDSHRTSIPWQRERLSSAAKALFYRLLDIDALRLGWIIVKPKGLFAWECGFDCVERFDHTLTQLAAANLIDYAEEERGSIRVGLTRTAMPD